MQPFVSAASPCAARMAEDRAAALARVRQAVVETREVLDVLLRVHAALKNAPDVGALKSAAEDLCKARRRVEAVACNAQRCVDAIVSAASPRAARGAVGAVSGVRRKKDRPRRF